MMKFLPVFIAISVGLFAGNASAEGNAASGEAKVAVCGACHGADGNSAIPSTPNLAGQGEKYLFKQLQDVVSGERVIPEMTGLLNAYSGQDLQDIAAYYASLDAVVMGSQEIEDEAYGLSSEEFLALGERIFRGGNLETGVSSCTGCHAPSGAGNAPASFPAIAGQHSEYLVKQLKNFQNNLRTNDGEGRLMRAVAAPMSDLEIRAVANYLSGLN